MVHYQPNVCQVPATRVKKISLGGAFSLGLAGALPGHKNRGKMFIKNKHKGPLHCELIKLMYRVLE